MTTLEKAARAVADAVNGPGTNATLTKRGLQDYGEIARAALLAVLPTLERYDPDADGYGWYGMSREEFGDYVKIADLKAILNDGEGE